MFYTAKLSRRLALNGVLAASAVLIACAPGEPLSPSAPLAPPPPTARVDTALAVWPKTATAPVSSSVTFSAFDKAGTDSVPSDAEWTASGGSVSQSGVFVGSSAGNYTVYARSRRTSKRDSARVAVQSSSTVITSIATQPTAVTLTSGQSQTFTATASLSDGSSGAAAVTWSSTGGVVSPSGVYTAGSASGTYRVIGQQTGGTLADTSIVTVAQPASATLAAVILTPQTVTLQAGTAQQFSAVGRMSDNTTRAIAVTWTATAGSVSTSGLFAAPVTAGTARIVATSGGFADTAIATVTALPVTLTTLVLNPSSVTLSPGASRQFAVSGSWSDGSASVPSVVYSATGGSISAAGNYVAGTTAGTFRVIAVQQGGTLADTSTIVISAPAATPPPPVSATGYPNQPAGFATLYDRPFNALTESGWDYRDYSAATQNTPGSHLRIMQDASAPRSASSVLEFRYPAGFLGGGEPGKTGREFPSSEFAQSMYMSIWVKFSASWQGHNSSVNKIVYWQMTQSYSGRTRLLLEGRGTGSGPLEVWAITQGTPLGDQLLLGPNLVPGAQFIRGRWHRVEAIVRMNTGSNSDGEVSMWLDGVKIMEHRNVIFAGVAEVQRLTGFEVTPVWGGVTDQVASEQFMWIDHLYLSGSN
jgi:hypothetical protein